MRKLIQKIKDLLDLAFVLCVLFPLIWAFCKLMGDEPWFDEEE